MLANREQGQRERRNERFRAYQRLRNLRNQMIYDSVMIDGDHKLLMEELGYRVDPIHKAILAHQSKHIKTLQLAPRGVGKSTAGTIGSALVKILRDPNVRILFASDIVTHAKAFLDELKACLTHTRVTEVFGSQQGSVWNEDEITVARRNIPRKEKTVMTTGVDSSITSAHFEAIYFDDLVTLRNSRTEGGRHKTHQWFYTTLMPCVTDASTEMRGLGTRYHPDDLYNWLMTKDPYFKDSSQIIPALSPADDSSNIVAWTTAELHDMRESMGHIYFNSQMNQDASSVQGYVFDDKFFRYIEYFPKNLYVFSGVDLAVGEKRQHDKFAICTIGVDPKAFKIYVLDYYTNKLSLQRQDEQIVKHYDEHNPIAIGIESNAFQASKVKSLRANEDTAHIPALPIHTDSDKMTRAQQLSVRFERGEVYFHKSEKGGQLEEQLLGFPNAAYKDLVDALDIAVRTALRKRKKKKARKREPGIIAPGGSRWAKRKGDRKWHQL